MKKITTILLLLLMALGIQAASKNGHFFKVLKNDNVSVENVEQCFDKWFSQPSGTEWRLVGEKTDQLGMQRIEYRQYVQGVEVEHSQVLLHVKDGKVMSANGTVMEVSQTPAKIKGGSTVYIGGTPTDLMGRKLYLVNTKDGYRYALKMLSIDGMKWVYTDADGRGHQADSHHAQHPERDDTGETDYRERKRHLLRRGDAGCVIVGQ